MKITSLFSIICAFSISFFSSACYAEFACNYDLRLGVVVGQSEVRLLDESRTLFQINDGDQVFFEGRLIVLTPQEQKLIQSYTKSLSETIPEITLLAKEGVGLATDNITRAYTGLVGENQSSVEQLHTTMLKVKESVKERYGHNGRYFFINPGQLETGSDIDDSLEAQITSGFSNVSGILTAIGTFDVSTDNDTAFLLKERAKRSCSKLEAINALESKIQEKVSMLKKLDAVVEKHRF